MEELADMKESKTDKDKDSKEKGKRTKDSKDKGNSSKYASTEK